MTLDLITVPAEAAFASMTAGAEIASVCVWSCAKMLFVTVIDGSFDHAETADQSFWPAYVKVQWSNVEPLTASRMPFQSCAAGLVAVPSPLVSPPWESSRTDVKTIPLVPLALRIPCAYTPPPGRNLTTTLSASVKLPVLSMFSVWLAPLPMTNGTFVAAHVMFVLTRSFPETTYALNSFGWGIDEATAELSKEFESSIEKVVLTPMGARLS